jgi:phosphatidylglycerophosphatase C
MPQNRGTTAVDAAEPVIEGQRVVLFDFDGVVLRGDAFETFVRMRLDRAPWRKLLGLAMCLPLLPTMPFTRRWVNKAFISSALMGMNEDAYRDLARAHGERLVRQPRRFHREALTRLRRHLADGDRVLVVTGCEAHLVQSIFAELGLDGLPILASRLKAGPLGMRVALHNVGRRKVESLQTAGIEPPWAVAYGDSHWDLPMLREAEEAVLVNATPKWCKRVERVLGRSVTRVHWY